MHAFTHRIQLEMVLGVAHQGFYEHTQHTQAFSKFNPNKLDTNLYN
jgi:hypothetical protein